MTLAAALAAGALVMAAERPASAGYAYTTYNGNDCVYETNPARLAMWYSASSGAKSSSSLRCPIIRTEPTYTHFYVEIMFGTAPSNTTVTCYLRSGAETDWTNGSASSLYLPQGQGSTMYMSLDLAFASGETTYWSAMDNDATAHWRSYAMSCDTLGVPILGYSITEWQ